MTVNRSLRRSAFLCLAGVTAAVPLAATSPASATQPRACAGAWFTDSVYGQQPVDTAAGFWQEVDIQRCSTTGQYTANIEVHPYPGYYGPNVQGCAVHVSFSNGGDARGGDQTVECTALARTGRPWSLRVGVYDDRYGDEAVLVSAYVNLRSARYISTQDTPTEDAVLLPT